MINPRLISPTWHQRFVDRARGKKHYRAGFEIAGVARFSRRTFRTALEADQYGVRVLLRWICLYDYTISSMVEGK